MELDAPSVGELEKEYLNKTIDSGFISTFGPFVGEFEDKFARRLGAARAVSTQSGTAALHVALYELGICNGDEVIVPSLTFIASVNPIVYVGAKPVFADVEEGTWNIDPDDVERKITSRTKAILPVHLYGNPCDMDRISGIARERNLFVVEDATESLDATFKSAYTGTIGDLGCFSFNGNKTITTAGGGMIAGNDVKRIEHIKFLVNQARDESRGYYHPEVGFNYRMTNIESALGLAQMEKLDEFSSKKRRFSEIYRDKLGQNGFVTFQKQYDGALSSWWLTCALFDERIDVASLQIMLKERKIPTRRIFMPVTDFPPYLDSEEKYPVSHTIYKRGLCLPSSTLNSDEDVMYVCRTIEELIS